MTEKLVKDIMHRGLVTCGPRTSLRDVARLMVKNDVSRIIVCTHGETGMCGVISDWLLAQARGADLDHLAASNIILPFTATVLPDATLGEAIELLRGNRISHLVVVAGRENGNPIQPIGIVSCFDIVKDMAEGGASVPPSSQMETSLSGLGHLWPRGC